MVSGGLVMKLNNMENRTHECPKDCLSCANSFSESSTTNTEKDVLHCMVHNEEIVD